MREDAPRGLPLAADRGGSRAAAAGAIAARGAGRAPRGADAGGRARQGVSDPHSLTKDGEVRGLVEDPALLGVAEDDIPELLPVDFAVVGEDGRAERGHDPPVRLREEIFFPSVASNPGSTRCAGAGSRAQNCEALTQFPFFVALREMTSQSTTWIPLFRRIVTTDDFPLPIPPVSPTSRMSAPGRSPSRHPGHSTRPADPDAEVTRARASKVGWPRKMLPRERIPATRTPPRGWPQWLCRWPRHRVALSLTRAVSRLLHGAQQSEVGAWPAAPVRHSHRSATGPGTFSRAFGQGPPRRDPGNTLASHAHRGTTPGAFPAPRVVEGEPGGEPADAQDGRHTRHQR